MPIKYRSNTDEIRMPLNTENIGINADQIPIPVKYRFVLPGLSECFPIVLGLAVVCLFWGLDFLTAFSLSLSLSLSLTHSFALSLLTLCLSLSHLFGAYGLSLSLSLRCSLSLSLSLSIKCSLSLKLSLSPYL